jgi:hypothetical protein
MSLTKAYVVYWLYGNKYYGDENCLLIYFITFINLHQPNEILLRPIYNNIY